MSKDVSKERKRRVMQNARQHEAVTQGSVAVYAKDSRRRLALARSLSEAGHSQHSAATPQELHRLLAHQQFDLVAMIVQSHEEVAAIDAALHDVRLPLHTILLGSANGLMLTMKRRRGGTLRFVPGRLTAAEITRLVDASISAGTWDESAGENGGGSEAEQVDLEEVIERAAAAVYGKAKRKRQRFSVAVSGSHRYVLGGGAKLRHMFTALLRLIASAAPVDATVSVNASAERGEWKIGVSATTSGPGRRPVEDVAAMLTEERDELKAVSQEVRDQGGMLWVELAGPAAPALCLTLPLPAEALEGATRVTASGVR